MRSRCLTLYIASATRGNLDYMCLAFGLFVAAGTAAYPVSIVKPSPGPRALACVLLMSLSLIFAVAGINFLFVSILFLDRNSRAPSTVHPRVFGILMLSVSCTHPSISGAQCHVIFLSMIHRTSSLSVSYLGALYWSLYLNTPSRVSPVSRFLVTYSGLPRINISLQRW